MSFVGKIQNLPDNFLKNFIERDSSRELHCCCYLDVTFQILPKDFGCLLDQGTMYSTESSQNRCYTHVGKTHEDRVKMGFSRVTVGENTLGFSQNFTLA